MTAHTGDRSRNIRDTRDTRDTRNTRSARNAGRRIKPVFMAVLALLAGACALQPAAQTAPQRVAPLVEPVAASRAALTRLLVLNCRESTDCATVGVGARACGGPEQYLAYALRETPEPALRKATQEHARLRRKQLEERGEMSTCELLPDPGARCTPAGQCELQTGRGAAPTPLTR